MAFDPDLAFFFILAGTVIGGLVVMNLSARHARSHMTEAEKREADAYLEEERRIW